MAADAPTLGTDVSVVVAFSWIMLWAILFVAIGINHFLARQSDSAQLFLGAGVLAGFSASLRFLSARPQSRTALVCNLAMVGAVLVLTAIASRKPELLTLRWTTAGHSNFLLFLKWGWIAAIWLTIVIATIAAEVEHVLCRFAR